MIYIGDVFKRAIMNNQLLMMIKQRMVLSLDGKSTHIKINPSRELRRIPTDSFKIEIICKPEIPEYEPEHLIGQNIKYKKYPILSKIGYDFGIDYNNQMHSQHQCGIGKINTYIVGVKDIKTIGQKLV